MSVVHVNAGPPASGPALAECCPICSCPRSTLFRRVESACPALRGTFELRRCLGCRLVFLGPRPSDAELAKLYDEEFYFSTGWHYDALARQVIDAFQAGRRRRVERHASAGRLLDIGSGDGSFVHHMARHGWSATGIDFSPAAHLIASRSRDGARFLQGSLADHALPARSFDVVTMWQVLEHIGEPRELLGRCRELLDEGGVLVAAVPNLEGLSSRLTGERWWGLDVPRHLVHYTPATLGRALERSGYRVTGIRHRSFQYDPYALLHSSLDWVFTRRHFLSDFAKHQVASDMEIPEYAWNVGALLALAPLLAPLALATTTAGFCMGCGGFIEVYARRD
jgi:2-polyprenyl-3-methyl-5-hydroxy-6-metoxy-1,4-benzoquinol methylase